MTIGAVRAVLTVATIPQSGTDDRVAESGSESVAQEAAEIAVVTATPACAAAAVILTGGTAWSAHPIPGVGNGRLP